MIFRYAPGNSLMHRLNPLSKLLAVAVFSIAMVLVDGFWIQVFGLAALVGIDYFAGSRKLHQCLCSAFVSRLALIIFVMQALFVHTGSVLLGVPLLRWTLVVTSGGLEAGVLQTLRFLGVILCGGVFAATTDPVALVYSLMKIGVPYRYGFMILMMVRFVPLFESERITIANAQKIRGLELDRGGVKRFLLSIRYTILPLIVSALAKTDVLVISMEGRAFGYKRTRTFLRPHLYSVADKILIGSSVAALILLAAGATLGWLPVYHLKI